MKKFYGAYNSYGIGTLLGKDNLPSIYVFNSKSARDGWINRDSISSSGHYHREPLTCKEAYKFMQIKQDCHTVQPGGIPGLLEVW